MLTQPTLLAEQQEAPAHRRGHSTSRDLKPMSPFAGRTSALPKALGMFYRDHPMGGVQPSLSTIKWNESAGLPSQHMVGHPLHDTGKYHEQSMDLCLINRGDKIWSCISYTGLQSLLRISYSHQRCIFHPGTRSRHINPTAHNTFTLFKICRWSMCRRRFYEQEVLEQPILVRGQHGSCQQRL